jgi:flagellin-like protein
MAFTLPMRRTVEGVSAVVGTILLVAITVVLAAVLYVAMSGIMVETPVKEPEFILDAGPWQNGSCVIKFLAVNNAAGTTSDNLNYIVQAQNGSIYYSGPAGGNKTLIANITVNITYQDSDGAGFVTPDDLIVIRVTPANSTGVRSSSFKVLTGSHVAGTINDLST